MAKVKTRGEQFAAILGERYAGMLVLAFSFPSESAAVGCHYACMEERVDYALWDGCGSQVHIVIPPAVRAALKGVISRFGGVERRVVL